MGGWSSRVLRAWTGFTRSPLARTAQFTSTTAWERRAGSCAFPKLRCGHLVTFGVGLSDLSPLPRRPHPGSPQGRTWAMDPCPLDMPHLSSSVYLLETFIFLDRNPLERDRLRVVCAEVHQRALVLGSGAFLRKKGEFLRSTSVRICAAFHELFYNVLAHYLHSKGTSANAPDARSPGLQTTK